MAYLTKNWLDGNSWRERTHGVEEVSLCITQANFDYEDVRITIAMTRDNEDYQILRLTNKDMAEILPEVLASMDEPVFLRCLEQAFAKRRKAKN